MGPVTSHSEREWILVGIMERCAAQGFEVTTVDDVCEAAGVSRKSFDELFAGMEDCLAAAIESGIEQAREAIAGATSSSRTWAANLRDGSAALFRFFADRPTLTWVVLVEASVAGSRAEALVTSARAELLSFLELGREQAAREVPASAARGALAGAMALAVGQSVSREPADLTGIAPDVVYMLAVPFLGVGEATQLAKGVTRPRHLRAVA